MSDSIVAVLCDHQCSSKGPLQTANLAKRLSKSSTVGKLIVLDKACEEPEKKLQRISGKKVLFAGCPYLEESGFYTLAAENLGLNPGDMLVTDIKSSILDLYEDPDVIEENLVGRLESLSRLLRDSAPLKDRPVKLKRSVLIFGSGYSGLKAALELCGEKLSVDLVETEDPPLAPGCLAEGLSYPGLIEKLTERVRTSEDVAVFPETAMGAIQSVEEGFRVSFNGGEQREFGAVIFAPERSEAPAEEIGSWNLSQLYKRIQEHQPIKGRIVFVLDRRSETPPEVIQDVLTAAKAIKERSHAEIWILLKQLRVALPGLQELYDLTREMGVIFVKYQNLRLHNEFGDFDITGEDPQTGSAFRISNPDRVIIPGVGGLSASALKAAATLGLRLLGDQYTQPYSLWRLANESNHPGVLVCGSARGNMDASGVCADAASLVQALKARMIPEGITAVEHVASVDTEKCVYCLTCIRVCPYHAMGKNIEDRVAQPITTACQGCGICAAECPAEAITLRNLSQESILAAMQAL
jgi:heterodisulfide reductase subunit A-like polyferredoxin